MNGLELDKTLIEKMKKYNIPGIVYAIFDENGMIYKSALGYNDVKKQVPMNTEISFPIGSCVKGFTSASLAKLSSKGFFSWDDKVNAVLSDFRLSDKQLSSKITIRDMLAHRSGISKNSIIYDFRPMKRKDIAGFLEKFECIDITRKKFIYNNFVYSYMEYLIEILSQKSFPEYVKLEIFDALDMVNTTDCFEDLIKRENRIHTYNYRRNNHYEIHYEEELLYDHVGCTIMSTLEDIVKWVRMFINHGYYDGKEVIPYEFLKETISAQTRMDQKDYCMGWYRKNYLNDELIYHEGRSYGCNAFLSFLKAQRKGVIIIANHANQAFSLDVAQIVYSELFGLNWENDAGILSDSQVKAKREIAIEDFPEKMRFVGAECEKFEGMYYDDVYGYIFVYTSFGKLFMKYYNLTLQLICKEDNCYYAVPIAEFTCMRNTLGSNNTLSFEFIEEANEITKVIYHNEPEVHDVVFECMK